MVGVGAHELELDALEVEPRAFELGRVVSVDKLRTTLRLAPVRGEAARVPTEEREREREREREDALQAHETNVELVRQHRSSTRTRWHRMSAACILGASR